MLNMLNMFVAPLSSLVAAADRMSAGKQEMACASIIVCRPGLRVFQNLSRDVVVGRETNIGSLGTLDGALLT
jgi:hypothetical protein